MKPIPRDKLPRCPGESVALFRFDDHESGKQYGLKMEEPVSSEDYKLYGPWIASVEIDPVNKEIVENTEEIWEVHKLPMAIQGFIYICRQKIREEKSGKSIDKLIKAFVERELMENHDPAKDGGSPEREYPTCNGWILIDTNSDMELPWGEIVRLPDGMEYELIGGTPPLQEGATGKIVVMAEDRKESEHFPSMFDLKWIPLKGNERYAS